MLRQGQVALNPSPSNQPWRTASITRTSTNMTGNLRSVFSHAFPKLTINQLSIVGNKFSDLDVTVINEVISSVFSENVLLEWTEFATQRKARTTRPVNHQALRSLTITGMQSPDAPISSSTKPTQLRVLCLERTKASFNLPSAASIDACKALGDGPVTVTTFRYTSEDRYTAHSTHTALAISKTIGLLAICFMPHFSS